MSLRVLRSGVLTTVQDLGRPGQQQFGVSVGGAMDRTSLRIANWLAGNGDGAAALECTLQGPVLQLEADALVALCGGGVRLRIDGRDLPANRPVWIRAGVELSLVGNASGCRGYLAIAGGLDVPIVMGSRSTYLRARIGGFQGRALRVGDCLAAGAPSPAARKLAHALQTAAGERAWQATTWGAVDPATAVASPAPLRIIRGAQFDELSAASRLALLSATFSISPQSDRMGYRLGGPTLEFNRPQELLSTAVCAGTIQLPPEGQPIVLTADCAPTGGYPVVAHVATVDLPRLGQFKPGDRLQFQEMPLEQAQLGLRAAEAELRVLKLGIGLRLG